MVEAYTFHPNEMRDDARRVYAACTSVAEVKIQLGEMRKITDEKAISPEEKKHHQKILLEEAQRRITELNREVGVERQGELNAVQEIYNYYKAQGLLDLPNVTEDEQEIVKQVFEQPGGMKERLQREAHWSDPKGAMEFFRAVNEAENFDIDEVLSPAEKVAGVSLTQQERDKRRYQRLRQYRELVAVARGAEQKAGGTVVSTSKQLLVDLNKRLEQYDRELRDQFPEELYAGSARLKENVETVKKYFDTTKRIRNFDLRDPQQRIAQQEQVQRLVAYKDELVTAVDKIRDELLFIDLGPEQHRLLDFVYMVKREFLALIGEALDGPRESKAGFTLKTENLVYDWAHTALTADGTMFIEDMWVLVEAAWVNRHNGIEEDQKKHLKAAKRNIDNTLVQLYKDSFDAATGTITDPYYEEKYQYLDVMVNRINKMLAMEATRISRDLTQRPDPEATLDEWLRFFEHNRDNKEFMLKEARDALQGLLRSNARSISIDGSKNSIYDRYRALTDVLSEHPTDAELRYKGVELDKRRILFDMDLIHGQTRSMTCDMHGLARETGMGYSLAGVSDWFHLDVIREENPTVANEFTLRTRREGEGYKYGSYVRQVCDFFEDQLRGDGSKFRGAQWQEDASPKALKGRAEAHLATLNDPNLTAEVREEVVSIAYSICTINPIRFDTYASDLERGDSPAGQIAVWLEKYIAPISTLQWELYKGYKREPVTLAEMYDIRDWYEQLLKRKDVSTKPEAIEKLDNILAMAEGYYLFLSTIVPGRHLRKRHHLPRHGRANSIKSPYPTTYDFGVRMAKERLKLGQTIENWVNGIDKWTDFEHYAVGAIDDGKEFKNTIRGRRRYRKKLVADLHKLFNSKISGVKTNMAVNWEEVAELTISYIDRMFRQYSLFDKSAVGRQRLWVQVRNELYNSYGNLGSAGDIHLHDAHQIDEFKQYLSRNPNVGVRRKPKLANLALDVAMGEKMLKKIAKANKLDLPDNATSQQIIDIIQDYRGQNNIHAEPPLNQRRRNPDLDGKDPHHDIKFRTFLWKATEWWEFNEIWNPRIGKDAEGIPVGTIEENLLDNLAAKVRWVKWKNKNDDAEATTRKAVLGVSGEKKSSVPQEDKAHH